MMDVLSINDALDMMNSDFKLWECASTEDLGGGKVAKVINLPWGIGECRVELEGMSNASQRRAAVAAFAEYVRYTIDNRIDDEGITSRAQVAAAKAEQSDSGDSDVVGGGVRVLDETVQAKTTEDSEEACVKATQEPTRFGDDLATTRAEVDGRIGQLTGELASLCRQLKGIDAAIKAMEEDTDA